jgi:hypothetical protein
MKNLLSFISVVLLAAPSAQALTCRAEMIHSICGTGKVEISLDTSMVNKSFKIVNGDVSCWHAEITTIGEMEPQGKTYPYNDTDTYALVVEHPIKSEYGIFYYNQTLKKARLLLNSLPVGVLSTKYDLDCD